MAFADMFVSRNLSSDVPTTKGTEMMESLLLSQYKSSTNLKAYISAFTAEMDVLFEQTSKVYLGRTLEYASGHQLDVIGRILGQSRNIELSPFWFGFVGASGSAAMADEAVPAAGGLFLSEDDVGYTITPLADHEYVRLLRAKAMLHGIDLVEPVSRVFLYEVLVILMGFVPKTFTLTELPNRNLQLDLDDAEVPLRDKQLINYASRYFLPLGAKLTLV